MFLIPVVILLPMVMAVIAACLSKRSPFLRDALVVGTGIATFALLMAMVIGLGLWGGPLVSFLKDVAAGVTF